MAATGRGPGVAHVVVGVDGSEVGQRALVWAVEEARRRDATLDVVHAWRVPIPDPYMPAAIDVADFRVDAERVLAEAIAQLPSDPNGPTIVPCLVHGAPAAVLLEAAADADLLVVGSHGHGGFIGMLLGSVSQHVLHHATCPVVVVRGADVAAA